MYARASVGPLCLSASFLYTQWLKKSKKRIKRKCRARVVLKTRSDTFTMAKSYDRFLGKHSRPQLTDYLLPGQVTSVFCTLHVRSVIQFCPCASRKSRNTICRHNVVRRVSVSRERAISNVWGRVRLVRKSCRHASVASRARGSS